VIIIATKNGSVGIQEAMQVLKAGGTAVDAVEAGIRLVESNPDDRSVGYGGYPNLLGQVELDAGIMEGRDLSAGAVGAVQGYQHPISIARAVMEWLPHVLLVGEGAARFAAEMGFPRRELLTEEVRQVWEQRLRADLSPQEVSRLAERTDLWKRVEGATDPTRVGAGLYADNLAGAVACTGMGEMAIRAGTARSLVLYLQLGLSLAEAGRRAMEDLNALGGRYLSAMSFIALDRGGGHAGFSNVEGRTYIYFTDEMDEPAELPRVYVPTRQRWGERE
jgi:beta-aspartyl-peptidase (threonine type)